MEFLRYNIGDDADKLSVLFRPARSKYGYQGDNTPQNVNYAKAIELLTEAFGPAIVYEDWRDVVEVEGYVKKDVAKDAWYFNKGGVFSEIYLTSDLQINYLALALGNVDIKDVGQIYVSKYNENTEA